MLKIKDDVDLNELKKFGFEEGGWMREDRIMWTCYNLTNGGGPLTVDGKTRKIGFNTYQGGVWAKIDILFDLIQAGLVEKVKSKSK